MISEFDVLVNSYTNSSTKIRMSLKHLPSGHMVEGETDKSRLRLKRDLMNRLDELVDAEK